jgi:hypothetical protein
MSVAAVRASELSYPILSGPAAAVSLTQRYSGVMARDMGRLDNTHDGANNARRVLREKGEAAATAVSASATGKQESGKPPN